MYGFVCAAGIACAIIYRCCLFEGMDRGDVRMFQAGSGFRFAAEFFREPDGHIGFLGGEWLTMGMVLSLPMVLAGVAVMAVAYRKAGGAA